MAAQPEDRHAGRPGAHGASHGSEQVRASCRGGVPPFQAVALQGSSSRQTHTGVVRAFPLGQHSEETSSWRQDGLAQPDGTTLPWGGLGCPRTSSSSPKGEASGGALPRVRGEAGRGPQPAFLPPLPQLPEGDGPSTHVVHAFVRGLPSLQGRQRGQRWEAGSSGPSPPPPACPLAGHAVAFPARVHCKPPAGVPQPRPGPSPCRRGALRGTSSQVGFGTEDVRHRVPHVEQGQPVTAQKSCWPS